MNAVSQLAAATQPEPIPELRKGLSATPFLWSDPAELPRRQWLYGHHLIRGFVSATVSPGGLGKSAMTMCEALASVSGRALLGEWVATPLRVWVINLEDPRDELQRRITAAMLHHDIEPDDVHGRLFLDSGRERGLCIASQNKDGVLINLPDVDAVTNEILANKIDVVIVDPFVSSHQVNENDNGAIDLVSKEWGRIADRCNCAIELVHHTRKLGGEEATSEMSRGAVALLGTARSARVLNRMSASDKAEGGLPEDALGYFSVDRDKANLAPPGKRLWRRIVPVNLANGDQVGVVEAWEWPDEFAGLTTDDLLSVQHAIQEAWTAKQYPRKSPQAKDWAGYIVADVLGLDPDKDRKRIEKMLKTWLRNGALREVSGSDGKGNSRPCLEVGEWATE